MILEATAAVLRAVPRPDMGLAVPAVLQTTLSTPQGSTPDSAGWYHAAYVVAAVAYAGYAVSLWWRRRCLRDKV